MTLTRTLTRGPCHHTFRGLFTRRCFHYGCWLGLGLDMGLNNRGGMIIVIRIVFIISMIITHGQG